MWILGEWGGIIQSITYRKHQHYNTFLKGLMGPFNISDTGEQHWPKNFSKVEVVKTNDISAHAILVERGYSFICNMYHLDSLVTIFISFFPDLFFHWNSFSLCLERWTASFLGWGCITELLHRANYFSNKENKCDGVTPGVSEVLLNILLILHMIITW